MRSCFLPAVLVVWLAAWSASAAERVTSADVSWADAAATGEPEFRRHVVPLFSKLGCNMRNCHGSFQGQSGFRLSLFGFEPDLDQKELLEPDEESSGDGPRANLASPAESLFLLKPTSTDDHEGGQRMKVGS